MALNINSNLPVYATPGRSERSNARQRSESATTGMAADEIKADETPAGRVQKFVQASDELSAAASQFSNRRQYEKKGDSLSEGFERVLDEDTVPKAKSLLKVSAAADISIENLLRHARSLFPDDSDLVLVLRELLRQRQLSEKSKTLLKAMLQQVEEHADPRDLQAGINCGLKARLFGQKYLELKPALLRGSYRRFLQSERDGIEDYKDWIAGYGYQYRGVVLDFIESALLTDIDCQDPSCSRMEFGGLINKLGQLKRLRSADSLFIKKLLSSKAIAGLNKPEQDWLILLFSLLRQPAAIGGHLNALLGEDILLAYHHERSAFLQTIYSACKLLPHELFESRECFYLLLGEFERLAAIAHKHELIKKRRDQ